MDVNGNDIEDEGVKDLAEMLKVNTTLTEIDLYDNIIGPEGAKHFAEVIAIYLKFFLLARSIEFFMM